MVLRTFIHNSQYVYYNQPGQRRRGMKPTHTCILTWHAVALVYYCYTTLVSGVEGTETNRLVDLSHAFDNTTIYWVTSKPLNFTVIHNGTFPGKEYWYQADEISAATHGGTHLDSPCHFAKGHWCVSDIPIERLIVPAVVVDISKDVGNKSNVHLSTEHLKKWEEMHGKIPDGSLLLIRTGWSLYWPDPKNYTGTVERNESLLKFPSIRPEAAEWLVENRDIVGVGIDVMSVDIPGRDPQTHITLMDKNIYAMENVNLQEPLPPTGVKVYVMPMKLKGASGAPCRIIAEVPEVLMIISGNVGSSNSMALIWTIAVMATYWTLSNRLF